MLATTAVCAEERVLIISEGKASADLVRPVEQRITAAYQAVGYKVRFESFPIRRGIYALAHGEADADLLRFDDTLERDYPDVRRVPTPVVSTEIGAYALAGKSIGRLDSWAAAQRSGLRFGGLCGARLHARYMPGTKFECSNEFAAVMAMLVAGRMDVLVATRISALATMRQINTEGKAIVEEIGILGDVPGYHYVHARHADLVPALDEQFRRDQKSGGWSREMRAILHNHGAVPGKPLNPPH